MSYTPYRRVVEQREVPCPKCKGKGKIPGYNHVRDGVCFKCHGKLVVLAWVPVEGSLPVVPEKRSSV